MSNEITESADLTQENSSGLHVKIHPDLSVFQKRNDEWNDLVMRSLQPNVFLTFEWVSLWWKWFGKKDNLQLLEFSEGKRLVAIIPLYEGYISVIPGIKMSTLRFVGDGGPVYPDYLGPILAADDIHLMESVAGSIVTTLGKNVSTMWLSSMLLDSGHNKIFVNLCKENFLTEISDDEVCPYITLPEDYETFLSNLRKRRRELARRQLRKAGKKFDIRLECCDSVESVDVSFEHLRAIYKKSFRGQEDTDSCFNRNDYFTFHKEIAKSFAGKNWLRLYLLWFDDTPVAFVYGYIYNNIYWYYQTSYDQAYRKSGAGSVAIQLVIKAVIEEGVKEFDFLRGDEEYKFHFANDQRQMSNVKVFFKNNSAVLGYKLKRWASAKLNEKK